MRCYGDATFLPDFAGNDSHRLSLSKEKRRDRERSRTRLNRQLAAAIVAGPVDSACWRGLPALMLFDEMLFLAESDPYLRGENDPNLCVRREVACRSCSHFNGGNHPCHRMNLGA